MGTADCVQFLGRHADSGNPNTLPVTDQIEIYRSTVSIADVAGNVA
jgi:hypothetical protein